MNTKERFSLVAIALSLLLAGWLDGQDAAMADESSVVVACIHCAGER